MANRPWSPEQKAEALALYVDHGAAEAARRTGIPEGTIKAWAHRTGAKPLREAKNSEAVRCSIERRKRTLEERRTVLVEKLGELAELGVDWSARALERGDELSVRDAVGVFTRAIHDLQLLSGGATARGEHRELAGVEDVRKLRDDLAERRAKKAVGE